VKPILEPASARRILVGLAVGWVLLELIGATDIVGGPHRALLSTPSRFLGAASAGAFVVFAAARGERRVAAVVAAAGAVVAALLLATHPATGAWPVWIGVGFGVAAVAGSAVELARAARASRTRPSAEARVAYEGKLANFVATVGLPAFVVLTSSGLSLSVALHPVTLDGACYRLDSAYGVSLSFLVARAAASAPGIGTLCKLVYVVLPLAIALVHVVERRGPRPPRIDAVTMCLAAGLVGFALYHVAPVAGPAFAFADVFPDATPTISVVPPAAVLRSLAPRNAVPSLHTTWALLILFRAWERGRLARWLASAFLTLTLISTLVLGEHYLADLVIAVPFAVAIDAACTAELPARRGPRAAAMAGGAAIFLGWILVLRGGVTTIERFPIALFLLQLATVAAPLALRSRLTAALAATSESAVVAAPSPPATRLPFAAPLTVVFFLSGFAGLVYEVMFGKALGLTFGSTAQAALTVLATYMGGMAIGAFLGGRLAARTKDPLRAYAYVELAIGAWCAVSPITLGVVRAAYVALASESSSPGLQAALQIGLGGLALLPATIAMGATLPLVARRLLDGDTAMSDAVGRLYGANTLGAALGAIVTGYFVIPFFGLTMTTWVGVVLDLVVALVALRMAAGSGAPSSEPPRAVEEVAPDDADGPRRRLVATIILGGGGVVTLALEVLYTHLLAVVAGNSTYAFSLMLFAFLVGLGFGSAIARSRALASFAALGALEIGVAAAILAGTFVWEQIPSYFASYSAFGGLPAFGPRELVRFMVCLVAMAPPAVFIGAAYPVALEHATRGHPRPIVALGHAAAINTAGNIAGALLGSLVLIPTLGSLRALDALAVTALVLGLLPLAVREARVPLVPTVAAGALALLAVSPRRFDLEALASGANVYFQGHAYGRVIDSLESASGGLTTVTVSDDADGTVVHTMLTNGKFQGDDSVNREVKAQIAFGLVPLLHTANRDRALVVGFGVGVTTRTLRDAGFARTDVAELADDMLRLADKHFSSVNGAVLHDPKVHATIADGRNFLLLHEGSFQVISIEVTSIWFAGAAALYNREFYALAKQRLTPDGVLQQWVQLHHMTPEDLTSILATVRSEFPEVWLYRTATQGQIVACLHKCAPTKETLAAIDDAPGLRASLALLGGSARELTGNVLLDPFGVSYAVRVGESVSGDLVSTDDNLRLEYATPRANVLDYAKSFKANLAYIAAVRAASDAERAKGAR
jgi:spermidine synthase